MNFVNSLSKLYNIKSKIKNEKQFLQKLDKYNDNQYFMTNLNLKPVSDLTKYHESIIDWLKTINPETYAPLTLDEIEFLYKHHDATILYLNNKFNQLLKCRQSLSQQFDSKYDKFSRHLIQGHFDNKSILNNFYDCCKFFYKFF